MRKEYNKSVNVAKVISKSCELTQNGHKKKTGAMLLCKEKINNLFVCLYYATKNALEKN